MVKIGVLSDTHVKDRVRRLHPQILTHFSEAGVDQIWHAGDVCASHVIAQLNEVAPVRVVQGNADTLMGRHFPFMVEETIEGLKIAMTHGQGKFVRYLRDRIASSLLGVYSFRYFEEQAVDILPNDADILIFGHIHSPVNRYEDGRLLFNPGSCSIPVHMDRQPSIGILTLDAGSVSTEIILLDKIGSEDLTWTMKTLLRVNQWLGKTMPGLSSNDIK